MMLIVYLRAVSRAKLTLKNGDANVTHTPLQICGSWSAIHTAREYINEILLANNERYSLPHQFFNINNNNRGNILYNHHTHSQNYRNEVPQHLYNIFHHHNNIVVPGYVNDPIYFNNQSNVNHLERLFSPYNCKLNQPKDGQYEIFNKLPVEIWNVIFNKVVNDPNDAVELIKLRVVSRKWNNIIEGICEKKNYKVTKDLCKISFIHGESDDPRNWVVNLSKGENDVGEFCIVKELKYFMKYLNFNGKLFISGAGAMNDYVFDTLIQYKKFIKPKTVVFTGGLLNRYKEAMLAFLGMTTSIQKLHFQWCEPQNNFFDDSFLIVCPNMKGFLIQQTTKSLRCQPRINFTMSGLTQALSLRTDYLFIPYVRNFKHETTKTMMEKYFRLCDGEGQKYMSMISIGHIKRYQINAALDNLGWITREDDTVIAYQIPRPNLVKKDLPLFFHSVDCTGTVVLTTYNNGDTFGKYGCSMIEFNNEHEFTVNERSMIRNVHNEI
uniref:F-box domain-containing protein n=1 Tax=Parastrongyloides trichosuri TaxID=131310 RepID=A0A0N4ZXK6_PARTI